MHDGACLAYNTNSLGKPGDTANLHELREIIDAISIKVWRFIARKQYVLHASAFDRTGLFHGNCSKTSSSL
jgi:hypothetical protein